MMVNMQELIMLISKLMSKTNKSVEIEIQVQIENPEQLRAFLQKHGTYVGESHQVDSYYIPAHRDFTSVRPIKEWLRLRNSSGKYSINYKKWHYEKDGRSHFCDEYETGVGDIEQVQNILKVLDMKIVVIVDKFRKIWNYQDYEIALDSIKGLGEFVEIEYKGKDAKKKPAEITKEMISFLKKFNVGKILRNYVGYPFQLLFPKEVKFEGF